MDLNVGCVVYTETMEGISAEWVYGKDGKVANGSDIGIRLTELNTKRRFEGTFEITYLDANGSASPRLRLLISYESNVYRLRWGNTEKTTEIGIGFESDSKLLVGYTEVP